MKDILSGLRHTFYIYSHPFDGFWVAKREKIGNVKSSVIILILLVATTALRILNSGFLFSSGALSEFSIWLLSVAVVILVLLYCIANWALTTLLEGMGTFKEIFISLMYSLTPIVITNIPLTILSQILVVQEAAFYSFIDIIILIWTVFLILAGNMTIHEYTMFKSIVTVVCTVLAMIGIAVLVFLVCNLTQEVCMWLISIVNEIAFRL